MEDIARIADRVLVMNEGRVAMFDETARVFSRSAELEAMGLRVPQITRIMTELRKRGFDVDEGVLTVEQGLRCLLRVLGKEGAQDA